MARTLAAASLAGAACYLVHLSSAGAVDQVRLARRRGPARRVRRGLHAPPAARRHPLRRRRRRALPGLPAAAGRGDVEALWAGLADGTIDAVGSDHCQVKSAHQCGTPWRRPARATRYGLAGIGARLPLLLSAAAARGLPIERVARLAAENPARAFGHYPRKGALAPGSDADIVIFDPAGRGRAAGRRVRRRHRRQRVRGPGRPRPDPGGAAARAADRLRRRARR